MYGLVKASEQGSITCCFLKKINTTYNFKKSPFFNKETAFPKFLQQGGVDCQRL